MADKNYYLNLVQRLAGKAQEADELREQKDGAYDERDALPATAAQPEGGEWTTQDLECDGPNKWRVYFGGLEYVVMSEGSAIATAKAHNASLAAAQRNEKLWRAEWEQISETARVLQEKLTTARADAAATDRERERDADRVAYTSMNLHSYLHSKIRSRKVEVKQDAVEDEWEYQREYER